MNKIGVRSLRQHKFLGKKRPEGSTYQVKPAQFKLLKKLGWVDAVASVKPVKPVKGVVFIDEVPDVLKQPALESAFILGGGSSISNLDLGALDSQHVVAVNRSFETYPCSELFFGDMSFFEEFGDKIMALDIPKVTVKQKLKDLPGVGVLRRSSDSKTLQKTSGQIIRSNSGIMALNYLLQRGCKLVVLMGVDLREVAGRKHHHGGYTHTSPPKSCETMLKEWQGLRKQVWREFDADIIHATPGSALAEVEYLPLEDIVEAIKDKDYFGG